MANWFVVEIVEWDRDDVVAADDARSGRSSFVSSDGASTATSWLAIVGLSFSPSGSLSVSGQTSYTADLTVPLTSIEDLEADTESDAATIDALTIELAAEQIDSEALEEDNAALTEDLAAEREEVSALTARNVGLEATVGEAREVAEALVPIEFNLDSSAVDEAKVAGVDLTMFDEVLAALGRSETIEEWAASWGDYDGAWRQADRGVLSTGDDVLISAWERWNDSPSGSDEEYASVAALYSRALYLLLERLPTDGIAP